MYAIRSYYGVAFGCGFPSTTARNRRCRLLPFREECGCSLVGGGAAGECDDQVVGVVALTDIQQAWNTADIAQVLVKEAELAAGQGQDSYNFV